MVAWSNYLVGTGLYPTASNNEILNQLQSVKILSEFSLMQKLKYFLIGLTGMAGYKFFATEDAEKHAFAG